MGDEVQATLRSYPTIDSERFLIEYAKEFKNTPRYTADATMDMLRMVGMIDADRDITDVRWAAYMLATTAWETTVLKSTMRVKRKGGKPVLDQHGQPTMVEVRKWEMSMAPVDEVGHGKGRRYHEPVKIKLLPDGRARVTEHDGDRFLVSAAGKIHRCAGAELGARDGVAASATFDHDDGVEQVYFGRGYVQLTWWSNYAKASVALGRGFELLLHPERVKTPEIAYELMSLGMRTGKIFANGRKFKNFFTGSATNYEGARGMVNGKDHADDIARLARKFESVLRKSSAPSIAPQLVLP